VMNIRVLYNAAKFLTSWRPVSFSGRTLLRGVSCGIIQGGSNMTGTICVYTSHSLSRSYLNHLVPYCHYVLCIMAVSWLQSLAEWVRHFLRFLISCKVISVAAQWSREQTTSFSSLA
jgi:hypothetical protein